MANTILTSKHHTIDVRSTDETAFRTKGQSLGHVGAASDTRIEEDIDLVSYSVHNARKYTERGVATIHLSTSVVADDDTLDSNFNTLFGIFNALDTFHDNWAFPVLLQVLDVLPTMAETGKDSLRPFSSSSVQVLLNFLAVLLLKLLAEDGISEANSNTDLIRSKERVIARTTSAHKHCISSETTHPLSISLGLQPSTNVSSVTNSAENPASCALRKIDSVISLCSSPGQ